MILPRVDPSRAPPSYGFHCQLAKSIASAHDFTYDNYPALKDPL